MTTPNTKGCCEKCDEIKDVAMVEEGKPYEPIYVHFCGKPDCPCHSTTKTCGKYHGDVCCENNQKCGLYVAPKATTKSVEAFAAKCFDAVMWPLSIANKFQSWPKSAREQAEKEIRALTESLLTTIIGEIEEGRPYPFRPCPECGGKLEFGSSDAHCERYGCYNKNCPAVKRNDYFFREFSKDSMSRVEGENAAKDEDIAIIRNKLEGNV